MVDYPLQFGTNEEELVFELGKLGLTPLQARVYVALVMYGPNRARSLASIIGISRVDLYRILRGLGKRGLTEVILSNPSRYAAVDPARVTDILLKESENHLALLRSNNPSLIERLNALSGIKKISEPRNDPAQNHFKLKYGRQVLDTRERLINNSHTEILVIWSGIGLKIHSAEGLLDTFERASERGVNIRAITEFTDDDNDEIQTISRFATVRISENSLLSTLRSMIIDSRVVLLSATSLPASNDELIALWTDNPAMVNGLIRDFARLWETSLPVKNYLLQMKSR